MNLILGGCYQFHHLGQAPPRTAGDCLEYTEAVIRKLPDLAPGTEFPPFPSSLPFFMGKHTLASPQKARAYLNLLGEASLEGQRWAQAFQGMRQVSGEGLARAWRGASWAGCTSSLCSPGQQSGRGQNPVQKTALGFGSLVTTQVFSCYSTYSEVVGLSLFPKVQTVTFGTSLVVQWSLQGRRHRFDPWSGN